MQRLEVSCAVRRIYTSLGAKWLSVICRIGKMTTRGELAVKDWAERIFSLKALEALKRPVFCFKN